MDPDALRQFYEQETIRKAVKDYMHELLDEFALQAVYSEDDDSTTWGYPEARKTINKLFATLEERYGKQEKASTTNKAR